MEYQSPQPSNPNQTFVPELFNIESLFSRRLPEQVRAGLVSEALAHEIAQRTDTMLAMTGDMAEAHPEIPTSAYEAFVRAETLKAQVHGQRQADGKPYQYVPRQPDKYVNAISSALNELRTEGGFTGITQILLTSMKRAVQETEEAVGQPRVCMDYIDTVQYFADSLKCLSILKEQGKLTEEMVRQL